MRIRASRIRVPGVGERAEEDDGDVGEARVGLQAPARLIVIHLRHVDVEEDEVRGEVSTARNAGAPFGAVRTL
jgi:hypothetical protein